MAAATDKQWGRILAAAWRDTPDIIRPVRIDGKLPIPDVESFKETLEKNPRLAIDRFEVKRPDGTWDLVKKAFGIGDAALLNLYYYSRLEGEYIDFSRTSKATLHKIIHEELPDPVAMQDDRWEWRIWNESEGIGISSPPLGQNDAATYADFNNNGVLLSEKDWSKIYACMWIKSNFEDDIQAMDKFERDPAKGVRDVVGFLRDEIHKVTIHYEFNVTKLFKLVDKPEGISVGDCNQIVLNGEADGHKILKLIVRKCC